MTSSHKKDEFFLNRKRIQKSEVISLLESAGFSKSNPYYIVQQGKVANLCTMKDADRLQLLKEVAGTNVYEDRRSESMKILQETALKQEKVQEVLTYIEERLSELEQEKAELTEYESLDKQRKAIEYNIYHKEQASAQDGLHQLDALRENYSRDLRNHYHQFNTIQEEIANEELRLQSQKQLIQRLENKLTSRKNELNQMLLSRDNIENEIAELENKEFMMANETQESTQLLEHINQSIVVKEKELSELQHSIGQVTQEMQALNSQLTSCQSKLDLLRNKSGGMSGDQPSYRNKAERDQFIQSNLQSMHHAMNTKDKLLQDYHQHVHSIREAFTRQQHKLEDEEEDYQRNSQMVSQLTNQINGIINQRNQLQEERKKVWQSLEKANEEVVVLKQELSNNKTLLNKTLPYSIAQGLTIIENIVASHQIQGYYGPLIDNIIIKNPMFYNVLDKAGGQGLFNIIVDTDATASTLIKHLERQNIGRLTFLPLNRLRVGRIDYPREDAAIKALVEVALEFEDYMAPAVHLVFGGKLLARDLHAAADSAHRYGLDTYTMDGDHVSARGALEGGYHNTKLNKIQSIMNIRAVTDRITTIHQEIDQYSKRNQELEQSINQLLKEMSKMEIEKDHLQENNTILYKEIHVHRKDQKEKSAALETLETNIRKIESEIGNYRQQIAIYQAELSSPFLSSLTDEEVALMQSLQEEVERLQQALAPLQQRLEQWQQHRMSILQELQHNLYKSKEEVEYRLNHHLSSSSTAPPGSTAATSTASSTLQDYHNEIEKLKREYEHLSSSIEELQREAQEVQEQADRIHREVVQLEQHLESLRGQEQGIQQGINQLSKENDKVLNKKDIYLETIASKTKLMKDLGILSPAEVSRFQSHSLAQLMKDLSLVNGKLSKYSNINRKALDQYLSFSNQKDILFNRQKELDNDSHSINLLIQNLDIQKDNNIITTFQNVNKHFINVFSELVPKGKAKLVLRSNMDGGEQEEDLSSSNPEAIKNINSIIGIGVEVSFMSTNGRHIYHNMAALSGGQKALVALALIFAIQRCDPAPFYLFDEIGEFPPCN